MKKGILVSSLLLFSFFISCYKAYAALPPIFDIVVTSNVTDSYDYAYTLNYDNYDPEQNNMRGLSHWWLEINCAHSTIDPESIYGYTMLDDVQYDWIMEFNDNVSQVGGYTDWVIKWDVPGGIEIPKDPGGLIGYFGFHSSQPPTTGNWGAKDGALPGGILVFDNGTTQIPLSPHGGVIPEPASFSLLGLGLLGLLTRYKPRKAIK